MSKLIVSPAPHLHSPASTSKLMNDVLIALLPASLVSIYFYGLQVLLLLATCTVACVLFEYLIQKYLIKGNFSSGWSSAAAVTGVLLALNLPPAAPWWIAVIGAFVAIAIAKMTFGGLGQNIFNPALVGRVFLLISFPVIMTTWAAPAGLFNNIDAFSGATPLSVINEGLSAGIPASTLIETNNFTACQMLFARTGGSIGEVSAIALLIGFVYLLVRRVIRPHITLSIWVTVFVMAGIFNLINPDQFTGPIFNLLTGGMLLGSIFMATDYVTSPMTPKGQIIFGVGIGVIAMLIRYFGSYPEGVSFAILIMNCATPLLNKLKPVRFGRK